MAAEVRLGPETALTPIRPLGPAAYSQGEPAVASNGSGFLAVWADGRRGRYSDLYASRINHDGQSEEPRGRLIAEASLNPQIASVGGDYLLAYTISSNSGNSSLVTRRLDQDGVPIGTAHILTTDSSLPISLASNGTNYLLTIVKYQRAAAMLLDRDGVLLRTIWTGSDSLLAAGTHSGTYVVADYSVSYQPIRARPALHVIIDAGTITNVVLPNLALSSNYRIAAALSPNIVLFTWLSEKNELQYLLADYNGRLISGPMTIDPNVSHEYQPLGASWNGSEFEISYGQGASNIDIVRVTLGGSLVDSAPFVLSSRGASVPVSAAAAGERIFVWSDKRLSETDIRDGEDYSERDILARTFTSFDSLLAAPDQGNLISWSGPAQVDVKVARSGNHEIEVWSDRFDRIRVSVNGVPVSINGVPASIVPLIAGGYVDQQAAGASNSNFLVVWHDSDGRMLAERVAFDGQVLDSPPIVLSINSTGMPSIASDGSAYLIAWSNEHLLSFSNSFVFTARVEGNGTMSSSSTFGAVERGFGTFFRANVPQVVWTGNQFFAGYALVDDLGSCDLSCHYPAEVGGTPLSAAGQPSPAKPAVLFDDSSYAVADYVPFAVAAGAGKVMFVWSGGTAIGMAVTTAEGTPVAGPRIVMFSNGYNCVWSPAISWDGTDFVVAWIDQCDNVLRAMRLTPLGEAIEQPFDVASDVLPYGPSMAPTPDGIVIAYSRPDALNADAPRTFERTLARIPPAIPRRRSAGH
jgi:hypothetical protein